MVDTISRDMVDRYRRIERTVFFLCDGIIFLAVSVLNLIRLVTPVGVNVVLGDNLSGYSIGCNCMGAGDYECCFYIKN